MVSRAGMVVSPPVAKKQRGKKTLKNRRRYNLAVGATGAEISFPVVAVPKVGWRVLSFLLLAGLAFAFYWLWTSPQYTVTIDRVVVNGITRIDEESLLEKAGILNRPVFLVDPGDLSENLPGKVPALESLEVSVGLSGEVVIDAVERVPVIAWDQESISQVSWVDLNGKIFPAIGTSQGLVYIKASAAPPSPRVSTFDEASTGSLDAENQTGDGEPGTLNGEQLLPEQLLEPQLVKGILNLAQEMPAGSELIYDGEHGFGWQDPEFGWMVYFGAELDQTTLRIKVYEAIVEMFSQKQRKPVLISVEFLHAPYYRMEP